MSQVWLYCLVNKAVIIIIVVTMVIGIMATVAIFGGYVSSSISNYRHESMINVQRLSKMIKRRNLYKQVTLLEM